jgi:hypothetical protein
MTLGFRNRMAVNRRKDAALELMVQARAVLDSDGDTVVSVSEHACGDVGCCGQQTVILVMRSDRPTESVMKLLCYNITHSRCKVQAAAEPCEETFRTSEKQMRSVQRALVVLQVLVPFCAGAADSKVLVELNTIENFENRCRMNFVIENKSEHALDSMKLDLVVFGADGGIMRRLITEMAPLRPIKTVVRVFLVEAECRQVGAILVNDVTACVPSDSNACLDRLELSSRVKGIRLYK